MKADECGRCHVPLNDENWFPSARKRRWLICKECERKRQRSYDAENRGRLRDRALKKLYGISIEEYNLLNDQQAGLCAICREECIRDNLCVDHDHETGDVRGLLCMTCNSALGLFKDRVDLLQKAQEYLIESRTR